MADRPYEFETDADLLFRRLARAMSFSAVAMLVCGIFAFIPAYALFRNSRGHFEIVLFVVFGGVLIAMGWQLQRAASHFKRIATRAGSDIPNLLTAIRELTDVYVIQRWLWLVLIATLIIALVGTGTEVLSAQ
jgi:hypothetical protein